MRNLDGPGKQPWKVVLVLKPRKAVFGEIMPSFLCMQWVLVSFAFVEPFSLEPAPSSAFITFHVCICWSSCIPHIFLRVCYCIPLWPRTCVQTSLPPHFFFADMYFLEMYFRRKIFHIKYARASRMLVTMLLTFHPTILYNWFHMYIFLVMCVYIHNFYILSYLIYIFNLEWIGERSQGTTFHELVLSYHYGFRGSSSSQQASLQAPQVRFSYKWIAQNVYFLRFII